MTMPRRPPTPLEAACDAALVGSMSDALKGALDRALARGMPRRDILALARRITGGRKRSLVMLSVEAYLSGRK